MQNISKILSINKFILFWSVLFLSFQTSLANIEFPVAKPEVDSLKRTEESLWYVDGPMKSKAEQVKETKVRKQSKDKQNESESSESNIDFSIIAAIFQILIWLIVGAAILGAIYIIATNLKGFKFKSNPKVEVKSEKIIEEPDIKDIENIDFRTQIDQCIREKNYKLATRYYYLWVMKTLSEANLIVFNIDKTNQDYAQELSRKGFSGKDKFIQCTNYYEYLWFGDFTISESVFERIENTFKEFINKKA